MKTRRMFLIALCGVAMLTGTSSCKKEKQENENGEKMVIKASLGSTGNNSKTHLEGPSVMWDPADAFKLFPTDGMAGTEFTLTRIDEHDGKVGYFEGTHPGDAPYYACYPSEVTCSDVGKFAFAIPQSQSDNTNAGPMVGYMEEPSGTLVFKNVMSWLKVGLKGDALIKRVVLTDNSPSPANNKLNGTLTVSDIIVGNDDKISSFTTAMAEGTNKLEIVSNDGFQLTNDYTYFWFMVPAGSLANLNLSAYLDVAGSNKVLDLNKTITHSINESPVPGIGDNSILTANVNSPIIEGPLPGLFTVNSDGKKVRFSKGNLQYRAKGGTGGDASETAVSGANVGGTWRFAEHQWDCVGDATNGTVYEGDSKCNNAYISSTYSGWIDFFGWGTSGYNHGGICYQPWSTSGTCSDYYAYGSSDNYLYSSNGTADWGKNIGDGNTWRTLTKEEWAYLLESRSTSYGSNYRYADVKVSGVAGMLLFPDDFSSWPSEAGSEPATFNTNSVYWNAVDYTAEQFAVLQSAGCVFLPAAGARYGTSVSGFSSDGCYWSSSYDGSTNAYYLNILNRTVLPNYSNWRSYGFSVRLVSEN